MKTLRLILADQLSQSISSLENCNKSKDIILMCELNEYVTNVKHHKKKIAFWFSAMRHFCEDLKEMKYNVNYVKIDDKNNSGSLLSEVKKLLHNGDISNIVVTSPSEYDLMQEIIKLKDDIDIPLEIKDDNRFLCTPEYFEKWSSDKKNLRMEFFYREMRKKHSILMDGNEPIGGKWNFDSENRKPPKEGLDIPKPYLVHRDNITNEVIKTVEDLFANHFGDMEPFNFAVTRRDALNVLKSFIKNRLNNFGDYQDAMIQGEPWMYHSHISFYINCGLLLPIECVREAENAYYNGDAPLNAVEGFIRQIIGWREYVRGIYWLKMPGYKRENFFESKSNLPEFYWDGKTKMNCIKQCVKETKSNAYAHHIQRLMVLGNFALLSGIDPKYVNDWFLIVYADAYEWVELPNVSGMILFADGGYLASKPYAAGGNYINKMSDYCKKCTYKVTKKTGDDACPFNYLYWDFLSRNREKLKNNHRISMMYKTYDRMNDEKKEEISLSSKKFLKNI